MFAEVQRLEKALDAAERTTGAEPSHNDRNERKRKRAGTGRRDLSTSELPVIRVEISSPEIDATSTRIGVEETSRLGYERGGMRHIVLARVVYKIEEPVAPQDSSSDAESAPITVIAAQVPRASSARPPTAPTEDATAPKDAVEASVDAFFACAKAEHGRPRARSLVSTALGYAINQEQPLRRFLDDGRLPRCAPRLLVLDPFVRLHRVDENDAGQVSAVIGRRGCRLTSSLVMRARAAQESLMQNHDAIATRDTP